LFLGKGAIEINEDNALYQEIISKPHSIPLSDLIKINES
jgi:hypothetical protein